jgi:hypothetical protein
MYGMWTFPTDYQDNRSMEREFIVTDGAFAEADASATLNRHTPLLNTRNCGQAMATAPLPGFSSYPIIT